MVRKERERKKKKKKGPKTPKTAPKTPIFRFSPNLGCQGLFIALGMLPEAWRPFKGHWVGSKAIQGPSGRARLMSAISSLCTFRVLTSEAHLEIFLDSDLGDLGVLGKLWMSSFQKDKEIKNPTVGSKVMTLGRVLTRF